MTIDEAIKQFKEDAEYNRADLDLEWAEENEQVAEWLEELKWIKETSLYTQAQLNFHKELAYNRAIDDFVEICLKHKSKDEYPIMCFDEFTIKKFAEELKERG